MSKQKIFELEKLLNALRNNFVDPKTGKLNKAAMPEFQILRNLVISNNLEIVLNEESNNLQILKNGLNALCKSC